MRREVPVQMRAEVKGGRGPGAKIMQGQDGVESEAGLRRSPQTSGRATNGPEGESEKSRPASATGNVPVPGIHEQDAFVPAVVKEKLQKATDGNYRRYA